MSEPGIAAFVEAESGEAARAAFGSLLGADGAEALADALLREVSAEPAWRRHHTLERLRDIAGGEALHPRLVAALRDGADAERRNAARSVLAALAAPRAGEGEPTRELLEQLIREDPDADVRVLAVSALGESGNCEARPALESALRDAEENVVSAAADALGLLGDARAAAALAELVTRGEFWGRMSAIVALGQLRDAQAVPALAQAAADPLLAEAAAASLGEIGDAAGLEPLRRLLEEGSGSIRRTAQRAAAAILAASPATPVPPWLRAALAGQEEELERTLRESGDDCAARLLGVAGSDAGAVHLVAALASDELRPAAAAGIALLPRDVAAEALLMRLPLAEVEERAALLTALPALQEESEVRRILPYLADAANEVRATAAEALGRSREEFVLPALLAALEDPALRLGAVQALGRLGPTRCAPLADLLEDADPRVREAAADALAHCAAQEGERIRAALQRETDPGARNALIRALGAAGDGAAAVADLAPLLASEEIGLRFAAARALGETRSAEALAPLLEALLDPAPEVQAAALRALGELGDPRAAPPLVERLDSPDRDLRRTAATALREIAPPGVIARLVQALDDADWEIRLAAVRALARLGGVDPLHRAATADSDPLVRRAAREALALLGDSTHVADEGSS
ncbi:hypothetical protein BH24GEM3_BH24GEM3_24440 [soil metagenome]